MSVPYRLIQITDCHLFCDSSKKGYNNVNPWDSLSTVLSEVAHHQPDGLIITGDISGDDTADSYRHFLELLKNKLAGIPWKVIAGNHDNNPAFESIMSNYILKAGEPWSLGNWAVHGIDTRWIALKGDAVVSAKGKIDNAQLAAISAKLATDSHAHHLLAMHHHPLPTRSWMDKHYLKNADKLRSWLEKNEQFSFVIHGHIHHASDYQFGNTEILSAPSTCWQWQMTENFGVSDESPGYREIHLYENGLWKTIIRRCE